MSGLGYPFRVGEPRRTRFGLWRAPVLDLADVERWLGPRSRTPRGARRRAITDIDRARRQGTL